MITLRIIIVMFLWATCYPLIGLGLPFSPHLTFATLRALLAGAALLAVAFFLKRPLPRGGRIWGRLAIVGMGATTLGFLGMFHAAEFVSPGVATVIANTQPILAALLAHFILREYLDLKGQLGLFLGFLGIVVIATPQLLGDDGGSYAVGVGYILLAAVGITVSNVVIRQISGDVDPLMAMGAQLVLGSVPLAALALATEDPLSITWSGQFIVSLIGLAFFTTALVYWMWFRILQEVQLTRANVFSFLVPVFGLLMGYTFYREQPDATILVGAGITLVGIYLVTRATRPT